MEKTVCVVCGSSESKDIYQDQLTQGLAGTPYGLRVCEGCGLIFLDPPLGTRDVSQFYDQDYYGEENVRFWGPLEALSVYFRRSRFNHKKHFPAPGRALDIGCGRGEFLLQMHKDGWDAYGTEINEIAAKRARKQFGDHIHLGELKESGFEENFFDFVSLYHVIEHLTQPAEMIDEIHRVLKPGGLFLLSTPNADSWGMKTFKAKAFGMGILHNCFYFEPRHVMTLLDNRFEIVSESHFSLEQDPFSYLQCFLNAIGKNDSFFYHCLHREKPKTFTRAKFIGTAILACLCLPLAALAALISPLFKKGYTMTYLLRKKANPA